MNYRKKNKKKTDLHFNNKINESCLQSNETGVGLGFFLPFFILLHKIENQRNDIDFEHLGKHYLHVQLSRFKFRQVVLPYSM